MTISHLAFITQSLAKIALVGYGEDDVRLLSPFICLSSVSSIELNMLLEELVNFSVHHVFFFFSILQVYLHTSPLVHIGGLSSAMAMLMVGASHVFLPKFDAATALLAMEQQHVTCFITVPAMMADLVSVHR